MNIFETFKGVKALAFNLDGVLADSHLLVTGSGEQIRSYDSKDNFAIRAAIKAGFPVAVVTNMTDLGIQKHIEGLGASLLLDNTSETSTRALTDWAINLSLDLKHVLYMGSELSAIPKMQIMGITTCPTDAAEEVKQIAHYTSARTGGNGAVRDVIEKTMKLQGKWPASY